jgi:hypothetical protein
MLKELKFFKNCLDFWGRIYFSRYLFSTIDILNKTEYNTLKKYSKRLLK